MHTYIERSLEEKIKINFEIIPVLAILGPRQCGKSTLAKKITSLRKNVVYLDLERPSDINQLRDPELFFTSNKNKLICLDEIQRMPSIFNVMRSIIDDNTINGQFLILGSASPELIQQTSESLAGRISYVELTPLLFSEVCAIKKPICDQNSLWLKGGFPRSLLQNNDAHSFDWRLNFIRTFLEQDIPNLGIKIPSRKLHRFWRMFAHVNGQILNNSKIATSLGVSSHTVRNYIDLLENTYMLRVLEPYTGNLKKRLVKSPKVYIRDTGILHALLELESMNDLFAHPIFGSSWEGFVIEQILSAFPQVRASFYRNSNENEIDLILEYKEVRIAVECKASSTPKLGRGFTTALKDLNIKNAWVITPLDQTYKYAEHITVSPLSAFLNYFTKIIYG